MCRIRHDFVVTETDGSRESFIYSRAELSEQMSRSPAPPSIDERSVSSINEEVTPPTELDVPPDEIHVKHLNLNGHNGNGSDLAAVYHSESTVDPNARMSSL